MTGWAGAWVGAWLGAGPSWIGPGPPSVATRRLGVGLLFGCPVDPEEEEALMLILAEVLG